MRVWICVHLPHLPLEAHRPSWSAMGVHVVFDKDRVVTISPLAAKAGVSIGMRRGGVLALCPATLMLERDSVKEREALDSIAMSLLQYTPEVAHQAYDCLVLDVTASLSAFGGILRLCRRIRASVQTLGFTLQMGLAPTAQAAWLFARVEKIDRAPRRSGTLRRMMRVEKMTRHLNRLPYRLLSVTDNYRDWLEGIGCRTLGDLGKLPRAGLQRRTSKQVLEALDLAYGNAPELFEWVRAPLTFSARLEMPDRIEHAQAVLFGARRLIEQMVGWLVALQQAVTQVVLWLEHERGRCAIAPTFIEITLAEPAWQEEHLTRLLKERLGRVELTAPIIALRLEVNHVTPMQPLTESLFPEPGGTPADYARLLELLTARLGPDNVLTPYPLSDYRPEISNVWRAATADKSSARKEVIAAMSAQPCTARPFWLMEKPLELMQRDERPFYGSPLRLISGAERIEAGWWDGGLAVRDYFVAQGNEAAYYWIYRERLQTQGKEPRVSWFLHGLFA